MQSKHSQLGGFLECFSGQVTELIDNCELDPGHGELSELGGRLHVGYNYGRQRKVDDQCSLHAVQVPREVRMLPLAMVLLDVVVYGSMD